MKRLLHEPLVHFLGIGLGLFLLYAAVAPNDTGAGRIVISAATVTSLRDQYRQVWGRPPTADEVKQLVEQRITDEILYREGMAMQLDRDDPVIERRVRQKYELMAEEDAGADAPTDADLGAWLAANPESFRLPPVVSFRQVTVLQTETSAAIDALRRRLQAGADPARHSASSVLPGKVTEMGFDLVARDFGTRFADALAAAPVGAWSGPVASAYGLHLVRVDARTPSVVPPLVTIRSQVAREWENARRGKARSARLAALRQRYDIVVEGLPAGPRL